jgi:hypothetical protein
LPDGEASWVAVPIIVGFCNVADEVQLLGRIVLMDVFASTSEIVAAVLNTPEPAEMSV